MKEIGSELTNEDDLAALTGRNLWGCSNWWERFQCSVKARRGKLSGIITDGPVTEVELYYRTPGVPPINPNRLARHVEWHSSLAKGCSFRNPNMVCWQKIGPSSRTCFRFNSCRPLHYPCWRWFNYSGIIADDDQDNTNKLWNWRIWIRF